jgi:hypothetical protein
MAKQVIGVGAEANDGNGDNLRNAFIKVNDNFTELYDDDAGDVSSIIAGTGVSVDQGTGNVTVTNSAPDQTVALTGGTGISTSGTYPSFTITNDSPNATHTGDVTGATALTIANDAVDGDKIADDSIDSEHYVDGSIDTAHIADDAVTADKLANSINTEIAANTAKTGITSTQASAITANTAKTSNATHTGDVTGATALTIASQAVTTAKIADNNITYPKLSGTFTSKTTITTLDGTVTFDCDASSLFQLSGDLMGTFTIVLDGYTVGQVITIFPIKGSETVNLSAQGAGTNVFNKIGGDYNDDGSTSNVLQIECVDASAVSPVFFYSVAEFTEASSDI